MCAHAAGGQRNRRSVVDLHGAVAQAVEQRTHNTSGLNAVLTCEDPRQPGALCGKSDALNSSMLVLSRLMLDTLASLDPLTLPLILWSGAWPGRAQYAAGDYQGRSIESPVLRLGPTLARWARGRISDLAGDT